MVPVIQTVQEDITTTHKAAEALNRAVSRAIDMRSRLDSRMDDLNREVGAAKGHIALKNEVTATLERIQGFMHEATVGSYARLLTALVQDVINKDTMIDIDLSLERGQPAMTISSYDIDSPDYKSLIYENSGAMTNVVCTGLRIIAVGKSGGRKFLVLDEPDCWIRDSRVERFYEVLRGLCRDIGFQIVVISHHDASKFGVECRIINMVAQQKAQSQVDDDVTSIPTRRRGGLVEVKNPRTTVAEKLPFSEGTSWASLPNDHPGIRDIHIRNLATLENVSIELDPYMTVIAGDVDVGKSRITRAFRAALYGDVADSDIRHGQTGLSVSMIIEGGVSLSFSRQMKRNPVNQWIARTPDGEVMNYDGQVCESRGRSMPEWVSGIMGIVQLEDLDLQISHQKKPVFLLDQSATRQAVVLSVGQEVQWLADMQAKYKQKLSAWNQSIRSGEAEAEKIIDQLKKFYRLDYCAEHANAMSQYLEKIGKVPASAEYMMRLSHNIGELNDRLKRGLSITSIIDHNLKIPSIPDGLEKGGYLDFSNQINKFRSDKTRIALVIEALNELPVAPQLPEKLTAYTDIAQTIRTHHKRIAKGAEILSKLSDLGTICIPELPAHLPSASSEDIRRLIEKMGASAKILNILSGAPASAPDLPDWGNVNDLRRLSGHLSSLGQNVTKIKRDMTDINAQISGVEESRRAIMEEIGDICPCCGNIMDDGSGHEHAHERGLPVLMDIASHEHRQTSTTNTARAAQSHQVLTPVEAQEIGSNRDDDFGISF